MYSDRIDNKLGVTIKTCNRVKGADENQGNYKSFVEDSGFELKYRYRRYGYFFEYVLNNFEDLRMLIPPDK